jgi:exosome complex RNA-binding protein Csl4
MNKENFTDFMGIDFSTGPDSTVITAPCGNCGTYRTIHDSIMEKCPNCGEDETPLYLEEDVP